MDGFSATKSPYGYLFEHESVDLGKLQNISFLYDTDVDVKGISLKSGRSAFSVSGNQKCPRIDLKKAIDVDKYGLLYNRKSVVCQT